MPVETSEKEQKYFAEREMEARAELRKQMEANAKSLHDNHEIAKNAGTEDLAVAERIKALGFDGDSARAFDLLPLVHVAWADGAVQKGERAAILRVLEQRGITPGSEAFRTIETLLEEKPSDTYMQESMAVLHELTGGLGNDRSKAIVDLCIEVASASGGFLGLGRKIGNEEKKLIDDIVRGFSDAAAQHVKTQMLED